MQATSTLEGTPDLAGHASNTWSRAFGDIRDGIRNRELWLHLGWQDIKQRYRRSVIGPFWITISMGVVSIGLGLLFSALQNQNLPTFLPYVTAGFVVWGFISGCLTEGMETFITNEGLIKHLPAPLTVYVLRTVWRNILIFLHNIIIYVVLLILFFGRLDHPYSLGKDGLCVPDSQLTCHPGLSWIALSAIPAFAVVAINAGWIALVAGIISTRFRDIPPIINSLIQLIFYLTPLVWSPDTLLANKPEFHLVFQLNPIYHFIQIVRAPMIGQQFSLVSWLVVGAITIVGWGLALFALRNYRARVPYWV